MFEPEKFGEAMGLAIRDAVAPLLKRIGELEDRIAKSVDISAEIERSVVAAVAALPKPRDGKDADPEVVQALVAQHVDKAFSSLPLPANGKDANPEQIKQLVAEAVSALPKPKDGADVDMVAVERRIKELVEAIPVPKDGQSVTLDDVRPLLDSAIAEIRKDAKSDVERAVAAIPIPKDGRSVTLEDIRPVLDAAQARWELDFERRAVDTLQRAIDKIPLPKDGKDGLGFDDLSIEYDGERTVTLKFERGGVSKEKRIVIPVVLDRGIYKDSQQYEAGDGTTWDGSYWVAQRSTSSKPDAPDSGWRLAVKKGTRGADAYQVAKRNGFQGSEAEWLEKIYAGKNPAPKVVKL